MHADHVPARTFAEHGFDRGAYYEVHRDQIRPGWDFATWYIREDEVLPLYHLLGELLMGSQAPADSGAVQQQLVRMLVNTIKDETARHNEFRTEAAQSAIDRAEAWLESM